MRDRSVEYLRLISLFLIPVVLFLSFILLFQPYKVVPLKLMHKTLNMDKYGVSFNIREISWSDPLPMTFEVGYQPNPKQYGDFKEHLFYRKLDTYDKVKFSIQSTEPVNFLLKSDADKPSFSHEYLQDGFIFNGTITEYTLEYEANNELYLIFHFTTTQPIRAYTTRLEYTTNVTFNGQLYEFKNFRVMKWYNH